MWDFDRIDRAYEWIKKNRIIIFWIISFIIFEWSRWIILDAMSESKKLEDNKSTDTLERLYYKQHKREFKVSFNNKAQLKVAKKVNNYDVNIITELYSMIIPMPKRDIRLVIENGKKYNFHPALVFALIYKESRFDTLAKNPNSSARGYGQFIKSTGRTMYKMLTKKNDYNHQLMAQNPRYSIPMIFEYLNYIRSTNKNPDNIILVFERYYNHPNKSTRNRYAREIIKIANKFKRDFRMASLPSKRESL